MNTKTKDNNENIWQTLALVGIGILAIAFIVGIWGFFRSSKPRDNSSMSNQSYSKMMENTRMYDNSKMDEMHKEMAETLPVNKTEVPVALVDAGEFSENIYDAAKDDDWKTAEAKLNKLKESIDKLNSQKIGSENMNATLANLEKTISSRDKKETLIESNKFTFDAAELSAKYNTKVPIEITKLDFYGRELEIWAEAKDEAKLKATTEEIRKTWDAVKPKVEASNGKKQAAVFEELVKKTEAAKTIEDYAKLATPILDEVDNLENVFG
jgi:hypothetical protein